MAAKPAVLWGYNAEDGPATWAEHYPMCSNGKKESPINIETSSVKVNPKLTPLTVSFNAMPLKVMNNGHTIEVKPTVKNSFSVGGKTFKVLQFHFHHQSENTLNGKKLPMEAHIVAESKSGAIAVLAVFIKAGAPNPFMQKVWANMTPTQTPLTLHKYTSVNLKNFVPRSLQYYFYKGSFTTPPCTEGIKWYVLITPVTASVKQISEFAKIYPDNARPVEPLNKCVIEQS